jgi:hypothetical protein
MVELQKPLLRAPASDADECASTVIAGPYLPPDRGWHVTTAGLRHRGLSRPSNTAQFPCFQVRDQQRQRPIEDRGRISIGHHVSEEILSSA